MPNDALFASINDRLDHVSERCDRTLERVISIVDTTSRVDATLNATLVQLQKLNGTVAEHDRRIQHIENEIRDSATKRAIYSRQTKRLWSALLVVTGALVGSLASFLLKKL